MELIVIAASVLIVAALLAAGFRRAVREGKVVVHESGRFKEPIINPNGSPPMDTGYWREKYRREHEQGESLVEYAVILVLVATVLIVFLALLLGGSKPTDAQGTPVYGGMYDAHQNFENLAGEIRALHRDVYVLQTQVARLDRR